MYTFKTHIILFFMLFSLSSYHEYGFRIITINSGEYIRESETMPAQYGRFCLHNNFWTQVFFSNKTMTMYPRQLFNTQNKIFGLPGQNINLNENINEKGQNINEKVKPCLRSMGDFVSRIIFGHRFFFSKKTMTMYPRQLFNTQNKIFGLPGQNINLNKT